MLKEIKENARFRIESKKSIAENSEDSKTRQKSLGEVLIEHHLKDPSFDIEEVRNQVTGILTGVRVHFYTVYIVMNSFMLLIGFIMLSFIEV